MSVADAFIAVFRNQDAAEAAVEKLGFAGFDTTRVSVLGTTFHTDEPVAGFYKVGDRLKFWGTRGGFWGSLWGSFPAAVFISIPAIGPVVVLGYLVGAIISGIECTAMPDGMNAIGAALHGIGVPRDGVSRYEAELREDGVLVLAHGTTEDLVPVEPLLASLEPARLDRYSKIQSAAPVT